MTTLRWGYLEVSATYRGRVAGLPSRLLGDRQKTTAVFARTARVGVRQSLRTGLPVLLLTILLLFFALPSVTAAQTQNPAPPFAANAAAAQVSAENRSTEYVIGPQDLLMISILEAPELSREARVGPDGTVGLPYLAERLRLLGLTLSQAEELIRRKYQEAGILNQPNVSIALKELLSKPVTVMGSVRSPGVFQIGAQMPLMRVITQAGGFTDDAGTFVQVMRAGSTSQDEVIRVRIEDLRQGRLEANIQVNGGDTVNVTPAGAIFIVGAVNRPGRHTLRGDNEQLTLLRVVALAEDLKRSAKPQATVILRKDASGASREIPVDLKKILQRKAPDVPVLANDVVFVPDSLGKRAAARGAEAALQVLTSVLILGLL